MTSQTRSRGQDTSLTALVLTGILVVAAVLGAVIIHDLARTVPAAYVFCDDAFYCFTVARNVASGHGVTIDGIHATNGFQPLWTALLVPLYRGLHSDRAVFGFVYILSVLLWGLASWLFVRLVARYLPDGSHRPVILGCATLCFVADRDIQAYFFSGLETGLYATLLLGCLLLWPGRDPTRWPAARIGVLLGALMLARNDGVFFAGAFLASALVWQRHRQGIVSVAGAGVVASALLLPWLLFGYRLTGTIVPQGGWATGVGVNACPPSLAKIATTLRILAELFLTPFVPVSRLSDTAIGLLGVVAIGLALFLTRREVRRRPELVAVSIPYLAACALLVGYYTMASGAMWFYSRYFMPIKIVALFLLSLAFAHVLRRTTAHLRTALVVLAVMVCVGVNLYRAHAAYGRGGYMTPEALALLRDRPTTPRIGAFESGRVGYLFPEQIINLDGKVNLRALESIASGTFLDYLDRTGIDVIYCRPECTLWMEAEYPSWRKSWRDEGHHDPNVLEHLYRRKDKRRADFLNRLNPPLPARPTGPPLPHPAAPG